MKTATNNQEDKKNVQNSQTGKGDNLTVIKGKEQGTDVAPNPEKVEEKQEEVKAIINSFAVTAEDRIKRAENFQILSTKYTHLKMKNEELERFIISKDGMREKLVLENSGGHKIEVNNSTVLGKAIDLLKNELQHLLSEADREIKEFVI